METGEIYFVTSTIHKWQHLLKDDAFKNIIIQSLNWLSCKNEMDVFAFVLMPNHMHLIIRPFINTPKENPYTSLLKYTAHQFKNKLTAEKADYLRCFLAKAKNKDYCFWQRDSLAIQLFTPFFAFQKLNYIHLNPLGEKWNFVSDPSDYIYSSASFYERNSSPYPFLMDLREEF
jgi:REP element-mobilizing transposase RayT